MPRTHHLLVPTGLLVATLGVSTLTVQAVGALEGAARHSTSAHGADAPAWITVTAAGVKKHPLAAEGLTAQGTVDPDQGETIWYDGSGRVVPGQLGTAVVAGHVAYYDKPDVFQNLADVAPGDLVTVGYKDGATQDFRITSTEQVSKQGLQSSGAVWGDQKSVARVVLITCDDSLGQRADGHRKANFVAVAEAVRG